MNSGIFFEKDYHLNLLCFRWWQDWNLKKELVDHEMYVHVFAGTSLPSCNNCALKKASIDDKDQFELETAKTLHNNLSKVSKIKI